MVEIVKEILTEVNLTTTQHTKSYARIPNVYPLPGFIDIQLDSFRRLKVPLAEPWAGERSFSAKRA